MAKLFYIGSNGAQNGPFTIEELKARGIQHSTLVWTEGQIKWLPAGEVDDLRDLLKAVPPPLPKENEAKKIVPPPLPSQWSVSSCFGYKVASRKRRFVAAMLDGIIVGIPINWMVRENFRHHGEELMTMLFYAGFCAVIAAFLYPMWSGNIGHRIMGVKVISTVDGSDRSGPLQGALREFLKIISIYLLIPSIWILWDGKRQNLYDKALGTIVVKRRR